MPPPKARPPGGVYHRLEIAFDALETGYKRMLFWTLETSQAPIDLDRIEHRIDPHDPKEEEAAKPSQRCCPFCKKGTMHRIADIPRAPRGCCAQRAPP